MKPKFSHLMEEADIGSGEKTPAEIDDLEETQHLREQQEQATQQAHAMDGGLLQQVTEEQQYISQQESHTPEGALDSASSAPDEQSPATSVPLPPEALPKPRRPGKKAGRSHVQQGR